MLSKHGRIWLSKQIIQKCTRNVASEIRSTQTPRYRLPMKLYRSPASQRLSEIASQRIKRLSASSYSFASLMAFHSPVSTSHPSTLPCLTLLFSLCQRLLCLFAPLCSFGQLPSLHLWRLSVEHVARLDAVVHHPYSPVEHPHQVAVRREGRSEIIKD